MRTRIPLAITVAAFFAIAAVFTWLAPLSRSQDSDVPPPPLPTPADPFSAQPADEALPSDADAEIEGAEVLTRGPVHEAFASPTLLDPQPGPIVPKQPSEPIEEIPPDEQPEGENVIWIPGYWAWDDDRDDYLWISGLWRNAPPNQTWVTGYWSQTDDGYQWTPGFWTSAAQEEVTYLPEAPPESLEAGPTSPAPSENHFWIPGNWTYRDTRYAWRPGYWAAGQPNWIWVPARYVWSPGGYVFVNGFWDFPPVRRGCLFAPVYFSRPIYARPAFVYTPRVLINVGFFTRHLFARPSYCHYYFGDYYAARYSGFGFRPWFAVGIGGRGRHYDPFFTYYRWRNTRTDRDWLVRAQRRYETLRRDERDRPPHTFASLRQLEQRGDRARRPDDAIAKTLRQVKADRGSDIRLRTVDRDDRQRFARQATELRKVAGQRAEIEKKPVAARPSRDVADRGADRDRRRGERPSAVAAQKTLKLPTIATTKTRTTDRGGEEKRGRAVDKAKVDTAKNGAAPDRSPRTAITRPSPRPGDADVAPRRLDRTPSDRRDAAADAARRTAERARAAERDRSTRPELTRPDADRPRITRPEVTPRRSGDTAVPDDGKRRSVARPPTDEAPSDIRRGRAETPRRAEPRSQIIAPPSEADRGRAIRTAPSADRTPRIEAPRRSPRSDSPSSSAQPKIRSREPAAQPRAAPQPSSQPQLRSRPPSRGGSSKQPSGKGSGKSGRGRGGRADAGSPRSNFDLSGQAPTLSDIPSRVEAEREAVRQALGKPPSDEESTETARSRRRSLVLGEPSDDPAAAEPTQRGFTQSDTIRPGDANQRPIDVLPRQEIRRAFGIAETRRPRSGPAGSPSMPESGGGSDGLGDGGLGDGGARPSRTATAPPASPPPSQYDSLMLHGRVLSRNPVTLRPGTIDEAGNVDPRKAKDPIGSIGFGSSPRRFGAPKLYGPLGQPSAGGGQAEEPRGAGSFIDPSSRPRWQSAPQPAAINNRLPHGVTPRPRSNATVPSLGN